MKSKTILLSLASVALVAALSLIASSRHASARPNTPCQRFQVRGRVLELDPAAKTIRIAHEAIPDYMPAMTMPFAVQDWALTQGIAAGESVQFELRVTTSDSWIGHVEKIQSDTPAAHAAIGSRSSVQELEAERVRVGQPLPDFALLDQDGKTVHLKDFRGKAVLLTFIYTRCPLPNFCPLMSKNFAELEHRLSREFPNRYHLLSVTMDPEFDRPEVLKDYAARYETDSKDWTFATGDPDAIRFVAELMGLFFQKENGMISHDLRTALIGPDGRLVHLWKSNVWTPYEIQRKVRETLTGSEDFAGQ